MTDGIEDIDPKIIEEASRDALQLKHTEGPELQELAQLMYVRSQRGEIDHPEEILEEEFWMWFAAPVRARFIKLEERLKAMQDGIESVVEILQVEVDNADEATDMNPSNIGAALAKLNSVL